MPTPISRKPRATWKRDIPDDLILKWQSSKPKTQVRRPMTACQPCRTAKGKCNGEPVCDRCISRGHVCTYASNQTLNSSSTSESSLLKPAISPSIPTQSIADGRCMDTDADAMNHFSMGTPYDTALDNMGYWAPDASVQTLKDPDWRAMDANMNLDFSLDDASSTMQSTPTSTVQVQTIVAGISPPVFSQSISQRPPSLASVNPPFQSNLSEERSMTDTVSLPLSSQLSSLPRCQCRESLIVLVPEVNNAMQEKQLDEVFKGTQKVVEGFQDIVSCTNCKITCVDLICIMSAFQQTDTCFEYIAKADLGSSIQMSFGGYEVPINHPKLRAMLISSLIHQASLVLDAIKSKGQHMIQALCTPSPLAKANIGYLDTVIEDFKNVLQRVADMADQASSSSTASSSASSNRAAIDHAN